MALSLAALLCAALSSNTLATAQYMRRQDLGKASTDIDYDAKVNGDDGLQQDSSASRLLVAGIASSGTVSGLAGKQDESSEAVQAAEYKKNMAMVQDLLKKVHKNDVYENGFEVDQTPLKTRLQEVDEAKKQETAALIDIEKREIETAEARKRIEKEGGPSALLLETGEREAAKKAQADTYSGMNAVVTGFWAKDRPNEERIDPDNMKIYTFKTYKHRFPFTHSWEVEVMWKKLPIAPKKIHKVPRGKLAHGAGDADSAVLLESGMAMVDEQLRELVWVKDSNGYFHMGRDIPTADDIYRASHPMEWKMQKEMEHQPKPPEETRVQFRNHTGEIAELTKKLASEKRWEREGAAQNLENLLVEMEDTLKLQPRRAGKAFISVRGAEGHVTSFNADIGKVTAMMVKHRLENITGIPWEGQKLFHDGKEMEDSKLLTEYMGGGRGAWIDLQQRSWDVMKPALIKRGKLPQPTAPPKNKIATREDQVDQKSLASPTVSTEVPDKAASDSRWARVLAANKAKKHQRHPKLQRHRRHHRGAAAMTRVSTGTQPQVKGLDAMSSSAQPDGKAAAASAGKAGHHHHHKHHSAKQDTVPSAGKAKAKSGSLAETGKQNPDGETRQLSATDFDKDLGLSTKKRGENEDETLHLDNDHGLTDDTDDRLNMERLSEKEEKQAAEEVYQATAQKTLEDLAKNAQAKAKHQAEEAATRPDALEKSSKDHPVVTRQVIYVRDEDGSWHVEKEEVATPGHPITNKTHFDDLVDNGIPVQDRVSDEKEDANFDETSAAAPEELLQSQMSSMPKVAIGSSGTAGQSQTAATFHARLHTHHDKNKFRKELKHALSDEMKWAKQEKEREDKERQVAVAIPPKASMVENTGGVKPESFLQVSASSSKVEVAPVGASLAASISKEIDTGKSAKSTSKNMRDAALAEAGKAKVMYVVGKKSKSQEMVERARTARVDWARRWREAANPVEPYDGPVDANALTELSNRRSKKEKAYDGMQAVNSGFWAEDRPNERRVDISDHKVYTWRQYRRKYRFKHSWDVELMWKKLPTEKRVKKIGKAAFVQRFR